MFTSKGRVRSEIERYVVVNRKCSIKVKMFVYWSVCIPTLTLDTHLRFG